MLGFRTIEVLESRLKKDSMRHNLSLQFGHCSNHGVLLFVSEASLRFGALNDSVGAHMFGKHRIDVVAEGSIVDESTAISSTILLDQLVNFDSIKFDL